MGNLNISIHYFQCLVVDNLKVGWAFNLYGGLGGEIHLNISIS